jgi:AraC-like DNA-binding protein
MDLSQIDVAVRLGGITLALLLALLMFPQRRSVGMPAWLFPPLAICLSGFLIGNSPDPSLRLSGAPAAIAHFASGCTVVFLWWFCLACFDRNFRPRGAVLAVGLGWAALAIADRMLDHPALTYTLVALGFGIVAHLVWSLFAEREGDLIQKRHDARAVVAVLLGGQLLVDLCVDLVLGFDWRPLPFTLAQNAAFLGFSLWLASRVLAVRADVLRFEGGREAAPSPAGGAADVEGSTADDSLRQRLAALIEVERVHLDPDLTFDGFVQRMSAPERTVRRLVNHDLGFDHFRSFLNHHRLIEARRLLADPRRAGDKMIGIALDSGFASLPSFNRVFRAGEGCTPGAYRDRALGARAAGEGGGSQPDCAPATGFEKRSAAF